MRKERPDQTVIYVNDRGRGGGCAGFGCGLILLIVGTLMVLAVIGGAG